MSASAEAEAYERWKRAQEHEDREDQRVDALQRRIAEGELRNEQRHVEMMAAAMFADARRGYLESLGADLTLPWSDVAEVAAAYALTNAREIVRQNREPKP